MAIVKAQGIVLKSLNFSDTSRIVKLYTDKYGLQSVLAKGAKRPRSKFQGTLETFNHVSMIYYRKQNRELHTISQCEVITSFSNLGNDLLRFSVASVILEMVLRFAVEEEKHEKLFDLVLSSLRGFLRVDSMELRLLFLFYQWRMLRILGYSPSLRLCANCGRRVEMSSEIRFDSIKGGVLCVDCSRVGGFLITQGAYDLLVILNQDDWVAARKFAENGWDERNLVNLTEGYISYRSEDFRPLRSLELLDKI